MTVYLDHAATTPMRPLALEAMLPFLATEYGNPSGSHAVSRRARQALDEARDEVASCLGCEPDEVIFTGGGTEADNLAVAGILSASRRGGGPATAVCSAVEHHAVLHAVEAAGGRIAPVDGDGLVRLDALGSLLDEDVALVSVMLANNEVGTIQPLEAVAAVMRERSPRAVLHTDAVQAFAWMDLGTAAASAALVSVAAHKFGGPKGVGALVVRRGVAIDPILRGGGQERDRRSGTHNVAGVVGMAAAMRAVVAERAEMVCRVEGLRSRLEATLLAAIPSTVESSPRHLRLPNLCPLRFSGVESEALLVLLDDRDVCASAGSACASGALEASHVLTAMGVPDAEALTSLRLSLGWCSTAEDIDAAVDAVAESVHQLRTGSPTSGTTAPRRADRVRA